MATLDVVDDVAARMPGQHIRRQQHQHAVGGDETPAGIDHPKPVAIGVERQADVGLGSDHGLAERVEVLRLRRVRHVLVRQRRVQVAVEFDQVAAQGVVEPRRHQRCGRMPAVDDDLHPSRHGHVALDLGDVVVEHIILPVVTGTGGVIAPLNTLA